MARCEEVFIRVFDILAGVASKQVLCAFRDSVIGRLRRCCTAACRKSGPPMSLLSRLVPACGLAAATATESELVKTDLSLILGCPETEFVQEGVTRDLDSSAGVVSKQVKYAGMDTIIGRMGRRGPLVKILTRIAPASCLAEAIATESAFKVKGVTLVLASKQVQCAGKVSLIGLVLIKARIMPASGRVYLLP